MNISKTVYEIVSKARQEVILSNGLKHNQKETVKRIEKYLNNEFFERQTEGIFWAISPTRLINFAKSIDLDTKNLKPVGRGDINFIQAWVLRLKLNKWFKDNRFAITLNDLSEGLAAYGSMIWKLVDGEDGKDVQEVDLNNIYFDQCTKDLRKTPKVELHFMSEYELLEKEDVWTETKNGVAEVIKKGKDKDQFEKFEIWEYWGPYGKEGEKKKFYHCIGFGEGADEIKLFEEYPDKKDDPYYDFHIGKYRGRWMRIGVVERLFVLQERANMIVNENAASTAIASLLLLRSNDPNTEGANVLDQAVTGQIIRSADLQQIGIDNRTLNNFINEMRLIEDQADNLCHTPEVIQGKSMPSGTPFRGTALIANAARSTFEYINQRVGETVGYLMVEEILPSIAKKWNREDILQIAEDEQDISTYDDFVVRFARLHKINEANAMGMVANPLEVEEFAQDELSKLRERKIVQPKGFFNFDYGIEMNVTGESQDKTQQNDAYFNALQMIQANPAIVDIPLFKQYLENNGIPYFKISKFAKDQMQQQILGLKGGMVNQNGQAAATQPEQPLQQLQ